MTSVNDLILAVKTGLRRLVQRRFVISARVSSSLETLYLQSIPGFVQSIREIESEDDWVSEEVFLDALDGADDSP